VRINTPIYHNCEKKKSGDGDRLGNRQKKWKPAPLTKADFLPREKEDGDLKDAMATSFQTRIYICP
jgi:hypothetical protein